MDITVRLDAATVVTLVGELLPVTVLLDEEAQPDARRWIAIDGPRETALVEGDGLRVTTSGRVRWIAAGVPVLATLQSVRLMLRPSVDMGDGAPSLVFRPSLEDADLRHLPALLDRGVTGLVNRKLEARGTELRWGIGRLLERTLPMPATLIGVERFESRVRDATVEVRSDALELRLRLALQFARAASAAPPSPDGDSG